jgi:steroid delta-isomerase
VPDPSLVRQAVDRYQKAVNSRDLEAYVSQFTEDAVVTDPVGAPPHVGHDAIRAFWSASLEAAPTLVYEATDVHTGGDHVGFHFTATVTLDSGTMAINGIEVFQVAEDGRIKTMTAVWGEEDMSFG